MTGPKRQTPRGHGAREPERPRMAALSDLLGFPHHTCARGSKVERPFLVDLALALNVPNPQRIKTKEKLIIAAAEEASGGPVDLAVMTSPNWQGTIKNQALDVILDALLVGGLPSRLPGGVAARVASDLQAAQRSDADTAFDALNLSDERRESLRRVVERPGQRKFRAAVVGAYPGCAITGCLESAVLDAAHIRPYKGARTNVATNGICLRTDLHRLWDRGLLAVHERTHRVLLHPQVSDTAYVSMQGAPIRLPAVATKWPDSTALRLQREWCQL